MIILTPFATGFANWTFGMRSWEVFGAANEVDAPGSYLADRSVYRVPLGERFRVDGDMLLSAYRNYGKPGIAITEPDGRVSWNTVGSTSSVSAENGCTRVSAHLMRQPAETDTHFYVMYTSQRLETKECSGLINRIFG